MNKCMNCGAEYENDEKFCSNCGSKTVAVPETAAGKCATCGAALAAGSKFCSNCGAKAEAPMIQETPVIVASPPEPELPMKPEVLSEPAPQARPEAPEESDSSPEPEPEPESETVTEPEPREEEKVRPAQQQGRVCRACGTPALDGDEFCGICGTRLDSEPAMKQEPQANGAHAAVQPKKKTKKKNWIWFAVGGAVLIVAAFLMVFVFHVFDTGKDDEDKLIPIFYSDHDSTYMVVNERIVELEDAMFLEGSESELNAITNSGQKYLYYLADAKKGEGMLMRVQLDDPDAETVVCAEDVANAIVSADGESVLLLRGIEDDVGDLYFWTNGVEESIAQSVPESQFGLSPDGSVACYFVENTEKEETQTKSLYLKIGSSEPQEVYAIEENESIIRIHVFDDGVLIFQIRNSEEKTDRVCRYSEGALEEIGEGRLVAVFNESELLFKEDTSLYYRPGDGEVERITKHFFYNNVFDPDPWAYKSLFIDTSDLPEKRFILFELNDEEIILSECVPGEPLTEIVAIDQFKEDYTESDYMLLYFYDGLFGKVSESFEWLIYFDGEEWKLAHKTNGEWERNIDLPEDAQNGKFDTDEQYLYYKSDEKLMRYDLALDESERVMRDISSFQIIGGQIFAVTDDNELYIITVDDELKIAKDVTSYNKVGGERFYVLLKANKYDIDYYASADAEGINIAFDADRVLMLNSSGVIEYSPGADGDDADTTAEGKTNDDEELAVRSSVLPLTIRAYNNKYVINEFSIGKDADGKTIVTVTGTGFSSLPIRNGKVTIPVGCTIISGNKEYTFTSAKISSTKVIYKFNTDADPDSVVFYPSDDSKSRTKIGVVEY